MERTLFGRPITALRAAGIIAAASVAVTVLGGIAARIADPSDFDSLGEALWWAMQTVTTVGYGDVVPRGTVGRVIGAVLMLNGIALVAVVTSAVTAMFIEHARQRRQGNEAQVLAKLEQIELRLGAMEGSAGQRTSDAPEDQR